MCYHIFIFLSRGVELRQKDLMGPSLYGCGPESACMLILYLAKRARGDKNLTQKVRFFLISVCVLQEASAFSCADAAQNFSEVLFIFS